MDEPQVLRHIQNAKGFFDLGMWEDAWHQLDKIPPKERVAVPVLLMRLELLVLMKRFESAVILAESLISNGLREKQAYLLGSYAARYCRSIVDGEKLLKSGEELLREDAMFHYNLACYASLSGRANEAEERLEIAFEIDPNLRTVVLRDEDLQAVWDCIEVEPCEPASV